MKAKYFKVNYASSKNDMLSSALALIKTILFWMDIYLSHKRVVSTTQQPSSGFIIIMAPEEQHINSLEWNSR